MLNARALTEILTNNTDGRLCKRWFLMTRNGTLLAYTQPANIEHLHKQTALATLSWQQHQISPATPTADTNGEPGNTPISGSLHTLIVESESSNLIIRRVQPHLLLVLEGSISSRKHNFAPRVIREGLDGVPYHGEDENAEASFESAVSSEPNGTQSSSSVLALQRQRIDALAEAIAEGFSDAGFKIPEESSKIF